MKMAYSYETADVTNYGLLKEFSRENKQKPTIAESRLWEFLKKSQLGKPFRRQHIIGNYIADFICLPTKTIIEVDGKYHQLPWQQESDQNRTEILEKSGYKVLRFTNDDVLLDLERVLTIIKENIGL